MSTRNAALAAILILTLTGAGLYGQNVISTQAGLINHTEGAVFLNDKPVARSGIRFEQMRNMDRLRTGAGRAEVLLNPGTFLRLGQNSSVELLSSRITAPELRLLEGTAVMEALEIPKGSKVTLLTESATITVAKRGLYRLDHSPARLRVFDGQAEVAAGEGKLTVKRSREVLLEQQLVAVKFNRKLTDKLDHWSRVRAEILARANLAGAQSYRNRSGLSFWGWDPELGVYTFFPRSGLYISPYGFYFYSPGAVYYYYGPDTQAGGGSASYGSASSSAAQPSVSPGAWSGQSAGAAAGASARESGVSHTGPSSNSRSSGRIGP